MTVCIAALCNWLYPNKEIGRAVITAADRMLTSGDVEYEPPQFKTCFLAPKINILVAGDMVVHTEALLATHRRIAVSPSDDVENAARIYASCVQDVRERRAADLYLRALGLDQLSFLQQQKQMNQQLVFDLASQLQAYELDVEALVVGCDGNISAHIFHVDGLGIVTCHDDINFAAIGLGREHAKSFFMASKYPKILSYSQALPVIFVAKKRAEIAPGVGTKTDYFLITRFGVEKVHDAFIKVMEPQYILTCSPEMPPFRG